MMTKKLSVWLTSAAVAAAVAACGNTSATKTEKVDGAEWNVAVNKFVEFDDSTLGISTNQDYTVADTAAVNALIKEMKHCGNVAIAWTLPSADGSIWLTAYENEPLLSEKVSVAESNSIASYGDDIQIAFRFADSDKWAAITRENIGKRLVLVVNGQPINAPQVNCEITSGSCSVTIPADMVHQYLPDMDLRIR